MKKKESPQERATRLEYQREWRRKKKESDPDYWKRNYQKHKDIYVQWSKDHQHLQREKYGHYYNGSDAIKESRRKSLQKALANGTRHDYNNRRRAGLKQIISTHYKKEISKIYKNKPKGYHVDHIIPINNDLVCGLHVPWNLQYLTPEQNIEKSNMFIA